MSEQLTQLVNNLNEIKQEKDTKIIPENIKKGVTIFNVTGELDLDEIEEIVDDILGAKPEPELLTEFSNSSPSDEDGEIFKVSNIKTYKTGESQGYITMDFYNNSHNGISAKPNDQPDNIELYYKDGGTGTYTLDLTKAENYGRIYPGETRTLIIPIDENDNQHVLKSYINDFENYDGIDIDYFSFTSHHYCVGVEQE